MYINSLATAVPANEMNDCFVNYVYKCVDQKQKRILQKLQDKIAVQSRYTVLNPTKEHDLDAEGLYRRGEFATTAQRMSIYEKNALPLALKTCEQLNPNELKNITHLILGSCTGFYAPGLDLELQQALGLGNSIQRQIIGFMGCFAAINCMRAAYHIVKSDSLARVLVINLELCTLHLQDSLAIEDLLGFFLFADGCSAAIISAEKSKMQIRNFKSEVINEQREMIQWRIADSGFLMYLSVKVGRALENYMQQRGKWLKGYDLYAVHPGGKSIIDAVKIGLDLPNQLLMASYDILRNYGNMSSPSVMFVLKKLLDDKLAIGNGMMMAFGPGISVETMQFEKI